MLKQKELEYQLAAAKLEAQSMQAKADEFTRAHAQAKDEAANARPWEADEDGEFSVLD